MAIHTLRGTLSSGERRRLIVDDGQFTHAHRVKRFVVTPVDMTSGSSDCQGVLAIDLDGLTVNWRFDDNRQIGWAIFGMAGQYQGTHSFDVIDPDHVVVRDLWVTANITTGQNVNFLVELEPVTITEDQAVLALIKEVSQDV